MKKNTLTSRYILGSIFSLLAIISISLPTHIYAQSRSLGLLSHTTLSSASCSINSFTANGATGKISVPANSDVSLEWTTTNCDTVSILSQTFTGATATFGGIEIRNMTREASYILRASNSNNKDSSTITINIDAVMIKNCVLNSFTSNATNNTVNKYDTPTLSWSQSNCTNITLSSSDGRLSNIPVTNTTSFTTNSLFETTSFVLNGTDANGTISQLSLTIIVSGGTISTPCQIYSFTSNGSTYVQVSQGAYATLNWNISSGCSNVSISGDNGVYLGGLNGQSSVSVGPFTNTVTYTITAYGTSGSNQTAQTTVSVTNNNWNNGGNWNNNNCAINNFQASSMYITSGQRATLSWTTNGCTTVTITAPTGTFPRYFYPSTNGYAITTPLYGTTTFVLTANGNTSVSSPPLTVYVTGGPYPYNNNTTNGGNAISSVATNIGAYSVRLNGVFVGTTYPTTAWFEYGTDTNVTSRTTDQTFEPNQTLAFYDTIYGNPDTTYYYRAVTQSNGIMSRGDIMTVTTKNTDDTTVYTQDKTQTSTSTQATSNIAVTVTNAGDKIYIGDTVDYKINYANGTNKKLSNVILNIILPQGLSVVQTTRGDTISPTIINAKLGTLAPGQADSIFLQAKVGNNVSLSNTLVTNATMSFTYPNNTNDSAVGYVLNHAGGVSSIGGFALGAGFFPTTILGWLVTILIILAVILTIRRISKARHGGGGGGHH